MLEVPQLVKMGSRWIFIFSNTVECHSKAWMELTGQEAMTGIYYCPAGGPTGPIYIDQTKPLRADPNGTYYSGKLVFTPQSGWDLIACIFHPANGGFQGIISDPLPLGFTINLEKELKR